MRWTRAAAFLLALLPLVSCGDPEVVVDPPTTAEFDSPLEFVNTQRGKVVVLVLGMDGCAATRKATTVLSKMAPDLPADVVAARIEVPGPGQVVPVNDRQLPIHFQVDPDRDLAAHLDFFYYPTIYVLDPDGETRFAGGMDEKKLTEMIAAIRSEKPGDPKEMWTPPLVPIGEPAPAIAGQELERDGPTLVFFGSIDCPFSKKALDGMVDVEVAFGSHDIQYLVVEKSTREAAVAAFYEDRELSGDLVADAKGSLSEAYGVEAVPFFYLIDDTGTVAARGPYTPAAATKALATVLGVKVPDGAAEESCGAG